MVTGKLFTSGSWRLGVHAVVVAVCGPRQAGAANHAIVAIVVDNVIDALCMVGAVR